MAESPDVSDVRLGGEEPTVFTKPIRKLQKQVMQGKVAITPEDASRYVETAKRVMYPIQLKKSREELRGQPSEQDSEIDDVFSEDEMP